MTLIQSRSYMVAKNVDKKRRRFQDTPVTPPSLSPTEGSFKAPPLPVGLGKGRARIWGRWGEKEPGRRRNKGRSTGVGKRRRTWDTLVKSSRWCTTGWWRQQRRQRSGVAAALDPAISRHPRLQYNHRPEKQDSRGRSASAARPADLSATGASAVTSDWLTGPGKGITSWRSHVRGVPGRAVQSGLCSANRPTWEFRQ